MVPVFHLVEIYHTFQILKTETAAGGTGDTKQVNNLYRTVGMGSEKPRKSWNRTWQEAQRVTRRDCVSTQVAKEEQGVYAP